MGRTRHQLGNTSTCSYYAFRHKQSHHQLQDALDIGLVTQALVHIMRFDIQQSHHQLRDALGIGLATQALVHIMRFDI